MITRKDLLFLLGVTSFFSLFFISKELFEAYYQFNLEHGMDVGKADLNIM